MLHVAHVPSNLLFCVTVGFDANVFSKWIPVYNKTSVLNVKYYFLQNNVLSCILPDSPSLEFQYNLLTFWTFQCLMLLVKLQRGKSIQHVQDMLQQFTKILNSKSGLTPSSLRKISQLKNSKSSSSNGCILEWMSLFRTLAPMKIAE